MARLREIVLKLHNALRPGRAEPDLARELASHLALLEDEFRRRGLAPDAARLAARRALGGVEQVKELHRDARSFTWLDDARRDVRYAAQLLRRNPLFALTAAASLAIGIGATTTIFTIANGLLLRAPAGVADPARLADIFHVEESSLAGPVVPYAIYLGLRQQSTTLDGVYGYHFDILPVSLRVSAAAERVFANIVTPNYFTVLGVPAAAGRFFDGTSAAADVDPEPKMVLSHRFWVRRFNADPAVVGRSVWVNGHPITIAGVASEGFRGTSVVAPDVWVPASATGIVMPGSSARFLQLMVGGRLKPGVSLRQAAAEIEVLGRALYEKVPRLFERNGLIGPGPTRPGLGLARASPIPGNLRGMVATFLGLLMVLVSLVLIIACANLAGVLLARATARRREIAIRLAIGAGRARLVRQLLTETMMLFALGGAAGLWLARAMTSLVVALLPAFPVPVNLSLPLDGRVVAFAMLLSFVAALLSGLAPALQASRADVVSALKNEEQGPSDRLRLRHTFVVAQVAFSILLVVAAGLLGRALERVAADDRGFDPRGVELASIDLSMAGFTDATGPIFARDLITRVRELPGVQAATLADRAPTPGIARGMFGDTLSVPGVVPPNGQPSFTPNWNIVEPGYFATMRIPLVAGREFGAADRAGEQAVIVIPEKTARQLWPGEEAVGKHVLWKSGRQDLPAGSSTDLLVIGVAKDLAGAGPRGAMASLDLYAPLQQRYLSRITIIARSTRGQRLAGEIRGLVESMDPHLPILTARTLEEEMIGPVELQLRVSAAVSGSIGIVGMLLAAIGIYGVTAYAVTRRTREIGIRLAMGAERTDVVGMVLRQGMSLVALGSAIGLVLAAGMSRLLTRLLFGVPPLDPLTFGGAAVLFGAIGLAACYLPARRATRIDPLVALRYE